VWSGREEVGSREAGGKMEGSWWMLMVMGWGDGEGDGEGDGGWWRMVM
jgi:hypothetical protein